MSRLLLNHFLLSSAMESLCAYDLPFIEAHFFAYTRLFAHMPCYRVATISRLLQIIVLFCKRALQKRLYSAKETYHFKEPTNRSHPIPSCWCCFSFWYYMYIYTLQQAATRCNTLQHTAPLPSCSRCFSF